MNYYNITEKLIFEINHFYYIGLVASESWADSRKKQKQKKEQKERKIEKEEKSKHTKDSGQRPECKPILGHLNNYLIN